MFERILVPLDGSEPAARALPVAAEIARRFHGGLVLVEVVLRLEDWHRSYSETPEGARGIDLEEQAADAARLHLERVAGGLRGVRVDVDVRTGRPAEAINQAAVDNGCDLICIAAHGHGRAPFLHPAGGHEPDHWVHWTLGGISERVVHTSPVPVLVVRTQETARRQAAAAQAH